MEPRKRGLPVQDTADAPMAKHTRNDKPHPITLLPADILVALFSFIRTYPLLVTVSVVCKRWRSLALRSITSYSHGNPRNPMGCYNILKLLPSLTELRLCNGARMVLHPPTSLRKLCIDQLPECGNIGPAVVLPHLESIDVNLVNGRAIDVEDFIVAHAGIVTTLRMRASAYELMSLLKMTIFRKGLTKLHIRLIAADAPVLVSDEGIDSIGLRDYSIERTLTFLRDFPATSKTVELWIGVDVFRMDYALLQTLSIIHLSPNVLYKEESILNLRSALPNVEIQRFDPEEPHSINSSHKWCEVNRLTSIRHLRIGAAAPMCSDFFRSARLPRLRTLSMVQKVYNTNELIRTVAACVASKASPLRRIELDLRQDFNGSFEKTFTEIGRCIDSCVISKIEDIYIYAHGFTIPQVLFYVKPDLRVPIACGWTRLLLSKFDPPSNNRQYPF